MPTLRFFVNDKRISTAVTLNDGACLQVYPVKKNYVNENAWRVSWENSNLAKPSVHVEEQELTSSTSNFSGSGKMNVTTTLASSPKVSITQKIKKEDWHFISSPRNYTFPPGTYYIGDLCYVLGDDVYDNVYGEYDYQDGVYANSDTNEIFMVGGTAYGDGFYEGSDGNDFAVDAGIIGITPISCTRKNEGGGHLYTFTKPVKCTFKNGIFKFVSGDTVLIINTEGNNDEE